MVKPIRGVAEHDFGTQVRVKVGNYWDVLGMNAGSLLLVANRLHPSTPKCRLTGAMISVIEYLNRLASHPLDCYKNPLA